MKKTLMVILALVMVVTMVTGSISTVSAASSAKVSGGGSFISGPGWDDEPWWIMNGHSCVFRINAQTKDGNTATGTFHFSDKTSKIKIVGTFSGYFSSYATSYVGTCKVTGDPKVVGTQGLGVDIQDGGKKGYDSFQIMVRNTSTGDLLYAYAGLFGKDSPGKGNLTIK